MKQSPTRLPRSLRSLAMTFVNYNNYNALTRPKRSRKKPPTSMMMVGIGVAVSGRPTVNVTVFVVVLPFASVAETRSVWVPFSRGWGGFMVQFPLASAVVVIVWGSDRIVMIRLAFGDALPEMVG